jgi:hypothetical protein
MKSIFSLGFSIIFTLSISAQAPSIQWQTAIGGTGADAASCVVQSKGGGYVLCGQTGPNLPNYLVAKLSNDGVIQSQLSLISGHATSIVQANDSGYLVIGASGGDCGIVKLNNTLNFQWQQSFGGTGSDVGESVIQTNDGGYLIAVKSNSNDGDVIGNHGGMDYWVVKLSDTGAIQWQKSLGGSGDEEVQSVIQVSDSSYVIAGRSKSNDGDVSGNHGAGDYWIVKIGSTGLLRWQKSLGGNGDDYAFSILQTGQGDYVVVGRSDSNNGDVSGNHGGSDYWVVKLDSAGTILWQKSMGGSGDDECYSIVDTRSGNYVLAGYSLSNDGDVIGNHGSEDFWVLKIDSNGIIQWQKTLGGSSWDDAYSIIQSFDGGYVIAGTSNSNNGDVSENHGLGDAWVVKLDELTEIEHINSDKAGYILYPNPTKDELFIETNFLAREINIYNTAGILVSQPKQSANNRIDINYLAAGVYIIEVKAQDAVIKKRWVKK